MRLCVYTDAYDVVWSGIETQISHGDLPKPHEIQRHSPLPFLAKHFYGSQLGSSTLEVEAYAIKNTVDRMHWVSVNSAGFDLLTDNHNLVFLLDSLAAMPDLS